MKTRNKALIITLISILSVITITATIVFILLVTGKMNFSILQFGFSKTSNKVMYTKEFDPSYDGLVINADAAEVYVKEHDGNKIKVVVYSDRNGDKLKVKKSNSLTVDYKSKDCGFFCFSKTKGKIEVYLPSAYQDGIVIKNDVGDIKVSNLNLSLLSIDADVGDIKLDNIEGKLDIKADVGDVEVKNVTITKNSSIENNVGDIMIKHINDVKIDSDTDIGDEVIKVNNKSSNITLKLRNDVGDIEVK